MLHAETIEETKYRGTSEVKRPTKGVIKILVPENPKRPKTRGYKQFAILMRYVGKKLEEFKKEEGKHPSLDKRPGWPAAELRWCIERNFIKVS